MNAVDRTRISVTSLSYFHKICRSRAIHGVRRRTARALSQNRHRHGGVNWGYQRRTIDGWVEEAYEQAEPIIENVDLDPTPNREPPEDLVYEMNEIGAEHNFTVDLLRSCVYGGALSIGAGIGITPTGIGAGAGTLAVVGGGIALSVASCTVIELVNKFK